MFYPSVQLYEYLNKFKEYYQIKKEESEKSENYFTAGQYTYVVEQLNEMIENNRRIDETLHVLSEIGDQNE